MLVELSAIVSISTRVGAGEVIASTGGAVMGGKVPGGMATPEKAEVGSAVISTIWA